MASEVEHGIKVLGGILPDRLDRLEAALRKIDQDVFLEPVQKTMWVVIGRYFDQVGAVLSSQALSDIFRNSSAGNQALVSEYYDAFVAEVVDDASFLWSLDQLLQLRDERDVGKALREGLQILTTGKEQPDSTVLQGPEDARITVSEALAQTGRVATERAPEGNVRDEAADFLREYQEQKLAALSGTAQGVRFGIPSVDDLLGGLQPGEFDIIAAYSGQGKSQLTVQLAWNAVVHQSKNVVFLTTETLRDQVRRRIYARHSAHPMFGLQSGINNRDIKSGTLTDFEEQKLREVVDDFASNPDYGTFHLAQVPRGATLALTEAHLDRLARKFPIDLVILDYLALWTTGRKRQSTREELGDLIKSAKQIASTHNSGAGTTIVSPWQINRSGEEEARKTGMYLPGHLAETAESINTSDIVVSLLAMTDQRARTMEMRMQALKNRDGETSNALAVTVDYGTSTFRDAQMSLNGVLGTESLSGLV